MMLKIRILIGKVPNFACPSDKSLYITAKQDVISKNSRNLMSDCNHDEADTRTVVHVIHTLETGAITVQVCTVDTDVVDILVGKFHKFATVQLLANISVAFSTGKTAFTTSILSVLALEIQKLKHCPYFKHFLGVTQCLFSSANDQHGRTGKPILVSHSHPLPFLTS